MNLSLRFVEDDMTTDVAVKICLLQDATGCYSSIAIKMVAVGHCWSLLVTVNCHQVPLVMVQAKMSIGTEAEGARLLQEAEEEQNESFFLENTRICFQHNLDNLGEIHVQDILCQNMSKCDIKCRKCAGAGVYGG